MSGFLKAAAFMPILCASACGPSTKLPPLPPQADFCTFYQSYRYSKAAATVEEIDALRRHNANEMAFQEKCLLPDRPNSLGPR